MGNTVKEISTSSTFFISEIKNALAAKYAAGITFHYQTAADLIFTCTAVSSKVIRFNYPSDGTIRLYYADSWTSTTTLVNPITVAYSYSGTYTKWNNFVLAMGDAFILLNGTSAINEIGSTLTAFGKATNGDSIVLSAVGSLGNNSVYNNYKSKNITTDQFLRAGGFQANYMSASGVFYRYPLHLISDTNRLLLDSNSDPLTISGLSTCTFPGVNQTTNGLFDHCLITSCKLYDHLGFSTVFNPLLVEF